LVTNFQKAKRAFWIFDFGHLEFMVWPNCGFSNWLWLWYNRT